MMRKSWEKVLEIWKKWRKKTWEKKLKKELKKKLRKLRNIWEKIEKEKKILRHVFWENGEKNIRKNWESCEKVEKKLRKKNWEKVEKKLRKSWKKVEKKLRNIARGTTDPGYWVRNLNDLFQPKLFQIELSQKHDSSYRLNTLGPLCLWQCFSTFFIFF